MENSLKKQKRIFGGKGEISFPFLFNKVKNGRGKSSTKK